MKRLLLVIGLVASGPAASAEVKVLSPSIVQIGDPAPPAKAVEQEKRVGFVPTVPPPPDAPEEPDRPKVVSNPPSPSETAEATLAEPDAGKTSAIGEPEPTGDDAVATRAFPDMEMRLQ
jgi:hypothetical protein